MPPSNLLDIPPAVADLRQRVQHWRSTRSKRGRMPGGLWTEAARLARQHGIYAIAMAIRLNYAALKGWVEGSPKKKPWATPRLPAFVQLDPLPGISSRSWTVKVENRGGAKMTIRLPASTALDAVALLDAFLSRRR
jgi:hypothetical protein